MTPIRLRQLFIATVLCGAVSLVLASAQPGGATTFPGPDAFGYEGTAIPHTMRDISTSGTFVGLSDDEVSGSLPIGFSFTFYGTTYTQFQISSNGFIGFGGSFGQGCCSGQPIPSPADPNNIVAGWWEDLNLPQGNIRFQTLGSAPNRELVVGFYNVDHYLGQGVFVTFEIVLHEGRNKIEIQCATCNSDGGMHTIGIENATGTIGLEVFAGTSAQISQGWLLSPTEHVKVWIGLKNSDAVGLRLDLLAEVFLDGDKIGEGQLNNVSSGSSGFNNAILHTIPLAFVDGDAVTGPGLEVTVSARRTCFGGGHNSGVPRLWYNGRPIDSGPGRDAGSRFKGTDDIYYLRTGFALSTTEGTSRTFIDKSVSSSAACPNRPFTPFGTWGTTP